MIQIDVEMPNNCLECPMWALGDDGFICNIKEAIIDSNIETERPDWCPLREVANKVILIPEKQVPTIDSMSNDLISRSALINEKPEFLNEKVVRDTKYQTTKDRTYAKAWNDCNSYWLNTIINAPTKEDGKISMADNIINDEERGLV